MVISDDKNYVQVLKGIAQQLKENQIEYLLNGREGTINHWVSCLREIKPNISSISIGIITKDINFIIDKLGYE